MRIATVAPRVRSSVMVTSRVRRPSGVGDHQQKYTEADRKVDNVKHCCASIL